MVRSCCVIYQVLLKCLPKKWENKPPLIWHWDATDLAKYLKVSEFEITDGFSPNSALARYDHGQGGMPEAIHVPMELSWKPLSRIVFTLIHELAHANGFTDEDDADDASAKVYRSLNKKAAWKPLGIKLSVQHKKDKTQIFDDRIYSTPSRLPDYCSPWEDGKRTY